MENTRHECCDDLWGVQFAGIASCDEIGKDCLRKAGKLNSSSFLLLTGEGTSKQFQTIAACFGERAVLKATNCGTDAVRFAVTNIIGATNSVCAIAAYSYVGGDPDLVRYSSISRHDVVGGERQNVPLIPLPYIGLEKERDEGLERRCLQFIIRMAIRFHLEGTPLRGLCFESVLAYSGLFLHADFLQKLFNLLCVLNICPIIDETMTMGRCSGYVNNSLLYIDKIYPDIKKHAHLVIVGKVLGCGLVLTNDVARLTSPSRGTSTGIGALRVELACMLLTHLKQIATPDRIQSIRACYVEALNRNSKHAVVVWGVGLLVFATHRFMNSRIDTHQPYRVLPTIAVNAEHLLTCEWTVMPTYAELHRVQHHVQTQVKDILMHEVHNMHDAIANALISTDLSVTRPRSVWANLLGTWWTKNKANSRNVQLVIPMLLKAGVIKLMQRKRVRDSNGREVAQEFSLCIEAPFCHALAIVNA